MAGTPVKTEDGYKAIEEIEVGDKVWSRDEETGEQALKTVVQLFRNEKDVLVHIDVAREHIQTTLGHPFYVAGKGWVKAGELKAGNELILYDGRVVEIEKVRIEKCKPVTTYNFEVEDSHTYYVTQSDVLVHNACRPISPKKLTKSEIKRFNAENYKEVYVGKKGARFDIFKDTANHDQIWLGDKNQKIWIETGERLLDLFKGVW